MNQAKTTQNAHARQTKESTAFANPYPMAYYTTDAEDALATAKKMSEAKELAGVALAKLGLPEPTWRPSAGGFCMGTQKLYQISFFSADAKAALKTLIPAMESGFNVNTHRGDFSVSGEDAAAVAEFLAERIKARLAAEKQAI